MRHGIGWRGIGAAAGLALLALAQRAAAEDKVPPAALRGLLAAYPDHLARIDGNVLVWRDGTQTAIDDGTGRKPFLRWLAAPDIEDMLVVPYPPGPLAGPPPPDTDPGRARNAEFFARMYGDCRRGEVEKHLVDVVWLPRKAGQRLRVSRINGVAARLEAVSRELDKLPARFDRFLKPAAGGYVCRAIAGTDRASAHGYGIAVDIAVGPSDYWRWAKPGAGGAYAYRNRVPYEIVEVFERHGFIWGGKWHHYDTMHFEYRPELLARPAQ